jgi:hypothetical protein
LHIRHRVGTDTAHPRRYRRDMDEAEKVIDRLARIETLGRRSSPPSHLLDELRALVAEAEAWARLEGDVRARSAVTRLREEAEKE